MHACLCSALIACEAAIIMCLFSCDSPCCGHVAVGQLKGAVQQQLGFVPALGASALQRMLAVWFCSFSDHRGQRMR